MVKRFSITVPAPAGDEERTGYLYLPNDLKEGERLAVMYLFDGQTAFFDETAPYGESLRLGELLDKRGARILVVAVEADKVNRMSEYSPFAFESPYGNSSGGGRAHLEWLVRVLKPKIDAEYPTWTDRAHTMLAGSSLGGLMSLYGLAVFPEVFSAALAFSPSVWVSAQEMAGLLKGIPADCEVYFDYGEKELGNHAAIKESLLLAVNALAESGANFTFRLAKGAVHNEGAWKKRLPAALDCIGLTALK